MKRTIKNLTREGGDFVCRRAGLEVRHPESEWVANSSSVNILWISRVMSLLNEFLAVIVRLQNLPLT